MTNPIVITAGQAAALLEFIAPKESRKSFRRVCVRFVNGGVVADATTGVCMLRVGLGERTAPLKEFRVPEDVLKRISKSKYAGAHFTAVGDDDVEVQIGATRETIEQATLIAEGAFPSFDRYFPAVRPKMIPACGIYDGELLAAVGRAVKALEGNKALRPARLSIDRARYYADVVSAVERNLPEKDVPAGARTYIANADFLDNEVLEYARTKAAEAPGFLYGDAYALVIMSLRVADWRP